MKKTAVIFLLLIYGFATMGATIHLHYCMNEFVGSNIWHNDKNDECGKCGMKEKKGGCCKDDHKQLKLKTDHQKGAEAQYFKITTNRVLNTPIAAYLSEETIISLTYPRYDKPPDISTLKLYLLFGVFLI